MKVKQVVLTAVIALLGGTYRRWRTILLRPSSMKPNQSH